MSAGGGVDLREWVSAVLTAVRSSPVGRAVVNSRAATTAHAFAVRCRDERVPGLAAETAFFVMLAIFPGFLIAASLLGVLDVLGPDAADRAKRQVVEALNTVLTDEAAPAIASVQDLFERRRGRLLTVATLGALVTLSGAFAVAVGALNKAYGAAESRSWFHRRVLGMVMGLTTVVAVALALAVLVVGPLLGQGRELADVAGMGGAFTTAWNILRLPVMAVALVLWITTLFRVAPNRDGRWREALPGALLTTGLWLVVTAGFHLYLVLTADANPVLGAFGGGMIVMIWVYLLSVALLVGGELNAALIRRRRSPSRAPDRAEPDGEAPDGEAPDGPAPLRHSPRP